MFFKCENSCEKGFRNGTMLVESNGPVDLKTVCRRLKALKIGFSNITYLGRYDHEIDHKEYQSYYHMWV